MAKIGSRQAPLAKGHGTRAKLTSKAPNSRKQGSLKKLSTTGKTSKKSKPAKAPKFETVEFREYADGRRYEAR